MCLLLATVVDFFSASAGVDKLCVLANDCVTDEDAETGEGVKPVVLGRTLDFVVVLVGAAEAASPAGSGCRLVVLVDADVAFEGASEGNVAACGRFDGLAFFVTVVVVESDFVLARPSSCTRPSLSDCCCCALTNSLNKLFSPYRATRSAI